ncbi:nitroreductase family deazaflavin-dependent oxidoreductase [Xylanimonas protaetiae]|uniref:Nitroreductase family deazaflavin-dependent oxidoreductase n=1 Tax=Xylanimonas protaetiae TaxID=2509457 RepID=A0A4P6F3Q4_9MICO|nr:nitroreductase family deazaflavin-dependent oxidoreductase [Xylanimonas protaetiae]QAY70520.1 nitroreductase family deazaflavin-dependent oxidoreductase [Xylanimonas protaetiae]
MVINPRIERGARRFNPRMLAFARKVPPFLVLEHVGRKSGKAFQAPLTGFAARDPDSLGVLVVIPLPWGADTDWCRNVRHAGRFAITRRGVRYAVTDLRVVSRAEAVGLGVRAATLLGPLRQEWQFLVGTLHASGSPEL